MNRIQFQPGLSMPEFFTLYGSEFQCVTALEKARWPNGFQCRRCGEAAHCVLRGGSHKVFQCNACRHQRSHGDDAVARAIADALAFEAFSSEYIAHLIQARGRQLPEASPLVLMRRQDVLELELPPADLSAYPDIPAGFDEGGDDVDH